MHISPETQQFIDLHKDDDVRLLALQAGSYPQVDIRQAVVQISGRQAIAAKVPSWHATRGILYPEHLPIEQCSSEQAARYKASLAKGGSLVDLTGGFGIDCAFMSPGFENVTYLERQSELCDIARHNFGLLGLTRIHVENSDATNRLPAMPPCDCIFIDPARRDKSGGKVVRVSDCEPDVEKLEAMLLEKSPLVLVKLSPMLDLSLAIRSLPHTHEVHVVSVQNECKELLLVLRRGVPSVVPIHCVNLSHGAKQEFIFTREEESETTTAFADSIGKYLYEPNASILKAGAFRCLARRYALEKLHRNTHLYTSDALANGFPGRIFNVLSYGSLKDKKLLTGIDKANVATRNFPIHADALRKRLKLSDGGDIYLFGATINPEKKIIIVCRK